MSLCLASAGVLKSLSIAAFTLVWTHSIEKIEWQEDWRVTPAGLQIVEARVKGTGAGMEPIPQARLIDGWFTWRPDRPALPELVLGNSGAAGEWRICSDQDLKQDGKACRTLSDLLGKEVGPNVTTLTACDTPVTTGKPSGLQ